MGDGGCLPSLSVRESQLLVYQHAQRVLNLSMPGPRCLLSIISVHVDVMLCEEKCARRSAKGFPFRNKLAAEKVMGSTRRLCGGPPEGLLLFNKNFF